MSSFLIVGPRLLAPCLAVTIVIGVTGCGGSSAPDVKSEVRSALESVRPPLDRLKTTIVTTRPRSHASLVGLRAVADRAVDALDRAQAELQAIEASGTDDTRAVRQAESTVDELAKLASALAASSLSADRIQQAAARAELATDDLLAVRLPALRTDGLVADLRAEKRRQDRKQEARMERARKAAEAKAAPVIQECGGTYSYSTGKWDSSGDGAGLWNLTTVGVDCATAQRIAAAGGDGSEGFVCRVTETGYETSDIRCTKEPGLVIRYQGGS